MKYYVFFPHTKRFLQTSFSSGLFQSVKDLEFACYFYDSDNAKEIASNLLVADVFPRPVVIDSDMASVIQVIMS